MDGKPRVGQVLEWLNLNTALSLRLTVVALLSSGCVVLRPEDAVEAEEAFPRREVVLKGKTSWGHSGPFYWVEEDDAKKAQDSFTRLQSSLRTISDPAKLRALGLKLADMYAYQAGDLLAHEAWSVWDNMSIYRNSNT